MSPSLKRLLLAGAAPLTALLTAAWLAGTAAASGPSARSPQHDGVPSSAVLELLPDGPEKRKFLLDCTGCHQMDAERVFPGGRARTHEEWAQIVARMLRYAGAQTPFPVISAERDPEATAAWLTRHLQTPPGPQEPVPADDGVQITEFDYPHARDLPHDLIVDSDGKVVITGMFTDRMLRLDAATATYEEVPIPIQRANPRALEITPDGDWWVLLGAPGKIARYRPSAGEWAFWDIGLYGHDLRVDAAGRVWFNGHFTKAPPILGYVDPRTGAVRTFEVPMTPAPESGNPIPYGLRVAPDGSVWGTELHGNRIFRFDPRTERFAVWRMPTPVGGPRRPDFGRDGTFWVPEYAANRIARFDPETGAFEEYELPLADALPYITRVDRARGHVWIGTAGADAVLRFDPEAERFHVYPLPSRGALIRHMDIDSRTGDLWVAYGASPGIAPRIARVRAAGG